MRNANEAASVLQQECDKHVPTLIKCFCLLANSQTLDETTEERTIYSNGVGFGIVDAQEGTRLNTSLNQPNPREEDLERARELVCKYRLQITESVAGAGASLRALEKKASVYLLRTECTAHDTPIAPPAPYRRRLKRKRSSVLDDDNAPTTSSDCAASSASKSSASGRESESDGTTSSSSREKGKKRDATASSSIFRCRGSVCFSLAAQVSIEGSIALCSSGKQARFEDVFAMALSQVPEMTELDLHSKLFERTLISKRDPFESKHRTVFVLWPKESAWHRCTITKVKKEKQQLHVVYEEDDYEGIIDGDSLKWMYDETDALSM